MILLSPILCAVRRPHHYRIVFKQPLPYEDSWFFYRQSMVLHLLRTSRMGLTLFRSTPPSFAVLPTPCTQASTKPFASDANAGEFLGTMH